MAHPALALCRIDRGIDRDFGLRGVALTDFLSQGAEIPGAVVVDARGRTVVVGNARGGGGRESFALARYLHSGELDRRRGTIAVLNPDASDIDPGFGGDGKVLTDFRSLEEEWASAVLIDDQGRIVVAGSGILGDEGRVIALARYLDTGELDTSFDGDGKVVTNFFSRDEEWGGGVALDSQDRIIVAGTAKDRGSQAEIALARYDDQGQLDPTFDADGKVLARFGRRSNARDVVVGAGDTVIVAGAIDRSNWGLARFLPDGSPDPAFGSGGTVTSSFTDSDTITEIAIDDANRIIAAGTGRVSRGDAGPRWVVARYLPDGTVDTQFGNGGRRVINVPSGQLDTLTDMTLDQAGRIVLVGWVKRSGDEFALVAGRLFPDGEPDESFDASARNPNGFVALARHLHGRHSKRARVATDRVGRVLVATTFDRRVGGEEVDTVTGFLPSLHGWRFDNSNLPDHVIADLPATASVIAEMTLCGGMALGAKDHFDFDRTLPDQAHPPEDRSTLYNYLLDRQLHSLGKENLFELFHIRGPWGKKFHKWWKQAGQSTDDADERCARNFCPRRGRLSSDALQVLDWSMTEFENIEQALTQHRETILVGVIYDAADDLWDNHQVLAYHLEREGPDEVDPALIWIYDPNDPGDDEQRLRVTFARMEDFVVGGEGSRHRITIDTIQQLPPGRCRDAEGVSRDELRCVRGFFQMQAGSGNLPDVVAESPPSNLLFAFEMR